uniref:Uncharacterized protein n=1 Tax=Rhizophora mucronata TaxID=61149 RepID=A0A2P2JZV0_RHIMU
MNSRFGCCGLCHLKQATFLAFLVINFFLCIQDHSLLCRLSTQ